ncbi:unnamed protein product [Meloidogyne enterolobii]|uniref:Uncharacterized protein n=1 Tax=Meloidogyne enterolobii TaxID=390850 RepID=A0ACB0XP66_MELEN
MIQRRIPVAVFPFSFFISNPPPPPTLQNSFSNTLSPLFSFNFLTPLKIFFSFFFYLKIWSVGRFLSISPLIQSPLFWGIEKTGFSFLCVCETVFSRRIRSNTNQANPDYSTIIAGEEVLLCKVCSDRASGFHYGIFSCEGCKGFFRRSLQNKIDYRPCTQSQKCQIVRANRNRCQECRWRKCIEAGMSKDGKFLN